MHPIYFTRHGQTVARVGKNINSRSTPNKHILTGTQSHSTQSLIQKPPAANLATPQVWTAGQVIGLIHDIPTCAALVNRIEKEAKETIKKTSSLLRENDDVRSRSSPPEPASSAVESHMNNPQAEIWGVGKSKL